MNVDAILVAFMPGRGTTDALLFVRTLQEEYKVKESNCKSVDDPLWSESLIVKLELLEGFGVEIGLHQGSAFSPLLCAIAVDVMTENDLMNKIWMQMTWFNE